MLLLLLLSMLKATNTALKATITDTQDERAKVMEQLRQLQDEFVQASSTLDADVRALSSQAHGAFNGDSALLTYLQPATSAAVQAKVAAAVAPAEGHHAAEQHDAEALDAGVNDVAAVQVGRLIDAHHGEPSSLGLVT